jgi:hypothetical protein
MCTTMRVRRGGIRLPFAVWAVVTALLLAGTTCNVSAGDIILYAASTDNSGGLNPISVPNNNNPFIPAIDPGVTLTPNPALLVRRVHGQSPDDPEHRRRFSDSGRRSIWRLRNHRAAISSGAVERASPRRGGYRACRVRETQAEDAGSGRFSRLPRCVTHVLPQPVIAPELENQQRPERLAVVVLA